MNTNTRSQLLKTYTLKETKTKKVFTNGKKKISIDYAKKKIEISGVISFEDVKYIWFMIRNKLYDIVTYNKKYYESHREEQKQRTKDYYIQNKLEISKKQKNSKKYKKYQEEYYKKNRKQLNECSKQYYYKNVKGTRKKITVEDRLNKLKSRLKGVG